MIGLSLYIYNKQSIFLLIQLVKISCFSSTISKRQFLHTEFYGKSLIRYLQGRLYIPTQSKCRLYSNKSARKSGFGPLICKFNFIASVIGEFSSLIIQSRVANVSTNKEYHAPKVMETKAQHPFVVIWSNIKICLYVKFAYM